MKSLAIAAAVCLALSISAHATWDDLQKALDSSYTLEAGRDISGAISAIKTMKPADQDDSYLVNYRLGWLHYSAGLASEALNHAESLKYYEQSVGYYGEAVKLRPGSVEALLAMVQPLDKAGKTSEIIKTYDSVLDNDSQNLTALKWLAFINYSTKKDYKKAAGYYERVLKLYPTDVEMLLGLGYSYKMDGKKADAGKIFNYVLRLSPTNVRASAGLK